MKEAILRDARRAGGWERARPAWRGSSRRPSTLRRVVLLVTSSTCLLARSEPLHSFRGIYLPLALPAISRCSPAHLPRCPDQCSYPARRVRPPKVHSITNPPMPFDRTLQTPYLPGSSRSSLNSCSPACLMVVLRSVNSIPSSLIALHRTGRRQPPEKKERRGRTYGVQSNDQCGPMRVPSVGMRCACSGSSSFTPLLRQQQPQPRGGRKSATHSQDVCNVAVVVVAPDEQVPVRLCALDRLDVPDCTVEDVDEHLRPCAAGGVSAAGGEDEEGSVPERRWAAPRARQ